MYLFQSGNGSLKLVNSLNEEWNRMLTGEQYSVQYKVDFPVQTPLPTIKSITVNNKQICSGGRPGKCTDIICVQSLPTCYSQKEQHRNLKGFVLNGWNFSLT
jgi:hypothetical protein